MNQAIRPTVWVLKEQAIRGANGTVPMDYTPAYTYGDVKFITEFDLPIHPKSTVANEWTAAINKFLKEYDPERDYLILTGSPLAIFAFGVAISTTDVTHKILVWRREQGRYVPTTL
jgi:hypothetical protein